MKFLLVLCTFFFFNFSNAQKTYIWCGSLIDGISDNARSNQTIIIEGDKITGIQNGFTNAGPSDKVIDLKNKTVMPGWIDMHVHLEGETSPNRYLETFTLNPADYAFASVRFAEITLMTGFTTDRDFGGSGVNIAMLNTLNKGYT